jgi:hypothetical protein
LDYSIVARQLPHAKNYMVGGRERSSNLGELRAAELG